MSGCEPVSENSHNIEFELPLTQKIANTEVKWDCVNGNQIRTYKNGRVYMTQGNGECVEREKFVWKSGCDKKSDSF